MSHNVSTVALDRCVLATFRCLLSPLITWNAHTCRWGRPGHCIKRLVYSWRASRHGHKAVDSLHQSFQNQHLQTFVQSQGKHLSGVCVRVDNCYCLFASCFNIWSDELNGHHGHRAYSDCGWRRRPVDMEGSCVCVEYTDSNNRQGVCCDGVFKELRE